jgi:hypothetical protein
MDREAERCRGRSGKPRLCENQGDRRAIPSLLDHVHAREAECKQHAFKDLHQFDRKQWRQWSATLPQRAARVRPGSVVYLHLALEKWTAAYDLHKHALRTRSQVSWHELRIGIKRFRYTVENFLPRQHALWGDDLKELQDLLGEVHDLDVLWATAVEIMAFPDMESQRRWREKLNVERAKRLDREAIARRWWAAQSLWRVWRAELPSGPQLRAAAMSRLRVWAGYLDPDFSHSQRVAQLSLLLYDGLEECGAADDSKRAAPNLDQNRSNGPAGSSAEYDSRVVLQAAALMHDVGKAKGEANHQKDSYRMIRGLARPLGWSARELEMAAVVARYHRGALPRPRGKTMQRWNCRIGRSPWSWPAFCVWPTRWITRHGAAGTKTTRSAARGWFAGRLRIGAGGGILGAGPFGGRRRRGATFTGDRAAPAGAGAGVASSAQPLKGLSIAGGSRHR